MPELQKSNVAHVSVFMFLRLHNQSTRPFVTKAPDAGIGLQKMQDLTYFNGAATTDLLKDNAALTAHMMVEFIKKYYTQQREPSYENKTIEEIVQELVSLMVVPDKTVYDLATKADAIFRYANESSAAVPLANLNDGVAVSASTKKKLKRLGIQ